MDEEIYEIRKTGDKWKLSYPEEGGIDSPIPCYDKEGNIKSVIYISGDKGKLTESSIDFESEKEARDYAISLGAQKENIKVIKTKPRKKYGKRHKEPEFLKPF